MLLLAVLTGATLFAGPALANRGECRSLQLQIDTAPRGGGGNGAQAQKFARAIEAQKGQIAKAKSQMRRLRCGGSVITLGSGSNAGNCNKLNGALRSMNANLAKLNAQYKKLSGGGGGNQRQVLRARYKALGCDKPDDGTMVIAGAPRDNGIAAFFGLTPKEKRETKPKGEAKSDIKRERRKIVDELKIPGLDFAGDTFRTLCVRTCDGYYFPISFSTTKDNFKRDLTACESMCPGTAVQLFMHKVPEEESEDMVSEAGEPYKAMSYAFAYRRDGVSSDPACKCNSVAGMQIVNNGTAEGGIAGDAEADRLASVGVIPMPRADALIDPQTRADMAGRFDDAEIAEVLGARTARLPDNENVRVVGPIFLPDPSGAIDLQAPVRPLVR
ncbi:MAG: DUF2865 domain-containing protein [Rhizobiaceae bacterium]|nr:DUF2865 domain-containing protein [Rhizobiaceae bacterium]